eukprot:scaffold108845_cov75-Phaeocystis_antarctica.AAC.2
METWPAQLRENSGRVGGLQLKVAHNIRLPLRAEARDALELVGLDETAREGARVLAQGLRQLRADARKLAQVVHQVGAGAGRLVAVLLGLGGRRHRVLRGADALVAHVARVRDVALLVRRVLPRELRLRHQRAHVAAQRVPRDEVVHGAVHRQGREQPPRGGRPDHIARRLPDVLGLAQLDLRAALDGLAARVAPLGHVARQIEQAKTLRRDGVSLLEVRHELLDHLTGAVLQDEVVLDHQQRRAAVALRRAPRPQHSMRHRATALARRQRDAPRLDSRRVVLGINGRVPRPRHHCIGCVRARQRRQPLRLDACPDAGSGW